MTLLTADDPQEKPKVNTRLSLLAAMAAAARKTPESARDMMVLGPTLATPVTAPAPPRKPNRKQRRIAKHRR